MADYKTVLDVSYFNTVTSWSSVAKKVDGVIIRAGYRGYGKGTLTTDTQFASYIKGASNAGIPIGIYFYSQAINTSEAEEEATYTVNLIKGYTLSMPIFIDVEYATSDKSGRADKLSVATRTAVCKAFCDKIIALGYKAGVYTSDDWFNSALTLSSLTSYNLWVAKYSTTAPKYVSNYIGWQYTSKGSITGVSGNCDLTKWYGDISTVTTESSSSSSSTSSSSSSSSSSSMSSNFASGDKVTLNSVKMYNSSSDTTAASTKTGTYYVWDNTLVNGRLRLTNAKGNVGVTGKVTGWVNESDLTSTSSSTTTTSTSSTSTKFSAGDKVTLSGTSMYDSASATKASSAKTGTYYIWSNEVVNSKIRVTNSSANVGKSGAVTGWVKEADISKASSTSSSTTYTAGTKITLNKVNVYATATDTKASATKTGTFYLWDGTVTNNRIRITNSKSRVGKSGQVTGWISTSVL